MRRDPNIKMSTFIPIIIAAVVFIFGALMQHRQKPKSTPILTLETSPSATPRDTASPSAIPSIEPTIIPLPKPSAAVSVQSNLSVYPGASFKKTEDGVSFYETNDSGDSVFSWYQSMFKNEGFNIRTSVRTKANDKFKAVLQAVKDAISMKVTIDQDGTGSATKISVTF